MALYLCMAKFNSDAEKRRRGRRDLMSYIRLTGRLCLLYNLIQVGEARYNSVL